MNDSNISGEFFELCLTPGGHHVRIDLCKGVVTTSFLDWFSWHMDTREIQMSERLSHFVQPNGRIVGTRSTTGEGGHV